MKLPMACIGLMLACGVWGSGQLSAQPPREAGGAAASVEGARFDLRPEASRFDVGANPRREVTGVYERVIGDRGVFLIDRITGATLAVPNTSSTVPKGSPVPDVYRRPLTENPNEHSAAVRSYLIGAGVPQAEVSGTHVTATMAGGGPVSDGVQPTRSRLLWYTTHLERSLGGLPVEGSYAFTALDSDGRGITEGIYWPRIPEQVVRRAQALQQRLASPDGQAAFHADLQRVRPDVTEPRGTVSIVHTAAGYHGEFQASALYSVGVRSPNGGKLQIVRFDDTGTPVRMPEEVPSGVDSTKER